MRDKYELDEIAAGIIENKVTTTIGINENDLEGLFPAMLDMTLRDALKLINAGVHCVFQWNCKRQDDGTFDEWLYMTHEECNYVSGVVRSVPPKPNDPKKKKNNRRPRRSYGNKKTAHQGT